MSQFCTKTNPELVIYFSLSSVVRHSNLQDCHLHTCPLSLLLSLLPPVSWRHFTESCSARAGVIGSSPGCTGLHPGGFSPLWETSAKVSKTPNHELLLWRSPLPGVNGYRLPGPCTPRAHTSPPPPTPRRSSTPSKKWILTEYTLIPVFPTQQVANSEQHPCTAPICYTFILTPFATLSQSPPSQHMACQKGTENLFQKKTFRNMNEPWGHCAK